jgi:hypothetical protein
MDEFKEGELIIYQNGDRYEIGKIKRLCDNGAFVWYHEGSTAAKTPYDCMHKLINGYCIKVTTLGGEDGEKDDR